MPAIKVPGTAFLVGGAVRDELLGLPVKERDWVVVGSNKTEMLNAGFIKVGRQFPVFLHPRTHEEYALARRETKTGPGHGGFSFKSDASITLKEDLLRRDLTINAIAKSSSGEIIDPFGGQRDLEQKVIRHVSTAFKEDPLRCFRVARFAAKLPDFTIAPETIELIESMQSSLQELSAERVWNEWIKAIQETAPQRFYQTLKQTQTIKPWFADLDFECMTKAQYSKSNSPRATLAHIGWSHSKTVIDSFFDRLKSPKKAKLTALRIHQFGRSMVHFRSLESEQALDLMEKLDAFHSSGVFENFLEELNYVHDIDIQYIQQIRSELRQVNVPGLASKELAERLRKERLNTLSKKLSN